jgi:poly(3-hydroxybutyrate) depolymerase
VSQHRLQPLCALVFACVACTSDTSSGPEPGLDGPFADAAVSAPGTFDAAVIGVAPSQEGGVVTPPPRADASADAAQQAPRDAAAPSPGTDAAPVGQGGSAQALADLDAYLAMPRASRPPLADQPFARVPLSKQDATSAGQRLWDDFAKYVRESRAAEVGATESSARTISAGGKSMRYYLARLGGSPAGGRSLFISMHGGGNAGAATNDSQWRNQISLASGYAPKDAIWIAPRAPVDDWNMWFVESIDALFERLITDMIVFEGVNPNKVYINGYSAGGDGVYQLGPRMAERWAGAGMSAGHPNAASPLSLRNVPFAIHVGGADTAFDRNKKAMEWGTRLEMLAAADPGGYVNQWQVHAGLPHWMNLEDAVSIPFLQSHVRDPIPRKVVWEQADLPRGTSYWLAVDAANRTKGNLIQASYGADGVSIEMVKGVRSLQVRLSDAMLDLDKPVKISYGSQQLSSAQVPRTIATLARTLEERNDPAMLFSAEVSVTIP